MQYMDKGDIKWIVAAAPSNGGESLSHLTNKDGLMRSGTIFKMCRVDHDDP